jgi:hypothetical protein
LREREFIDITLPFIRSKGDLEEILEEYLKKFEVELS